MKHHYKDPGMGTDKIIFFIIGGFTLLALVGIFFFSVQEQKQAKTQTNIVSYEKTQTDRPIVSYSAESADLGVMKVKDEKKADFTIENKGTKPLQLYKINASCDCTFGKLTVDGNASPEFTMHAKSNWVGVVGPGKSATLSVIYRPFIMPVKGPVTRDVYVQTNDPEKPFLTFSVKAVVE